ncbi:MAG: SusC/RagA family TonB-linked outer membrane protein [Prevotella sp.]|nr:SusC/RagA family TonB-linked outer membrane protein [Prevotella sp.]
MFYRSSCYALMVSAVMMTGTVSAQSINSNDDNVNSVAVGYGTMSKDDITSCITSVKAEDLGKVANANALLGLQAKVPGMDIQQVSGEAGAGISMLLRGYRSFMDNNPLIIVDGAEYLSTFDIPASEIESINILKDAASTAIYGSRGANGVVIVNTKRGKAGKIKVNLDANWSFNSSTAPVKGMYGNREVQRWIDSDNYTNDLWSGNWGQSNISVSDFGNMIISDGTLINDLIANGEFTDWLGLLQQNSVSQNYNVSVGGGNRRTNFNVALSLMDDRGMLKDDQLKRYRVRANIDHVFSRIFKAGTNLSYTYKDNDKRNAKVFDAISKGTSLAHAYDRQTGAIIEFPDIWNASFVNPLLYENDNYRHNIDTKHFYGNVYLQVTPFKGFMWKTLFNLDYSEKEENKYSKSRYINYTNSPANLVSASNIEGSVTQYLLQNTASYDVNFGGMHDLNILIGNEYSYYKVDEVDKEISLDIPDPTNYYIVVTYSPGSTSSYNEFKSKNSLLSFFGRLNYSYAGKYLFQATLRTDGFDGYLTSGKYKWSTHPSFSAGWRITEEKFMQKTSSWLNNLKLRLSWGVSGSGNNSIMAVTSSIRSVVTSYQQYSFPNDYSYISVSDLTCEKTSTFDAGLDFTLLNGRLGGSIDYYTSRSHDLIFNDVARYMTMSFPTYSNVAKTKSHGFEIALNAVPVITKDFRWDVNASATFAKNEIVKLTDDFNQVVAGSSAAIIGQPMSVFYGYEIGNCWGVGEWDRYVEDFKAAHNGEAPAGTGMASYGTPGTVKIIDRNGDGRIDENDKRFYDRSPKAILGMTNTFSYKNFTLSIQMMARLGGYMAYEKNAYIGNGYNNWADVNYWTPSNTDTKFPSPGAYTFSDLKIIKDTYKPALQYEKADYFKINDITLSYNLEKNWLKSLRMENATVYCSLKNFITVNALDDNYDPERGGAISFPLSKQFVLGLNITF